MAQREASRTDGGSGRRLTASSLQHAEIDALGKTTMSLRGRRPWQSPAEQIDFADTYMNMEYVSHTMLIGTKQWRSAVQEIATSPPLAAPRNDSGFGRRSAVLYNDTTRKTGPGNAQAGIFTFSSNGKQSRRSPFPDKWRFSCRFSPPGIRESLPRPGASGTGCPGQCR